MNTELFIARRLFRENESRHHLSRRIIYIALAGIALGIMVMLLAVAIVTGFKKEIRDKVIGFGSHIQVVNYDSNVSYETAPVSKSQTFLPEIKVIENISGISVFATKPGIIKTDEYIQGVVLKGVDESYDWSFFRKHLTDGEIPDFSTPERHPGVLISSAISSLLKLKVGDPIYMYFIQENDHTPRIRQFVATGIYNSNLQEFDELFVMGDLRQIQHINNWDSTQVSGFEIKLKDFRHLEHTNQLVSERIIDYRQNSESTLRSVPITRKYPQIFDWLSILDMNVWVILSLMVLVAGFNMISALLVLILERSAMIGILKSLGSQNKSLRNIFLYLSAFLLSRGIFWGNLLGLGILFAQKYLNIIKLDPSSYYMDVVPVHISWIAVLLLNLAAAGITMLMLVIPAHFVSRISPDKTIRFD